MHFFTLWFFLSVWKILVHIRSKISDPYPRICLVPYIFTFHWVATFKSSSFDTFTQYYSNTSLWSKYALFTDGVANYLSYSNFFLPVTQTVQLQLLVWILHLHVLIICLTAKFKGNISTYFLELFYSSVNKLVTTCYLQGLIIRKFINCRQKTHRNKITLPEIYQGGSKFKISKKKFPW